VPLWIVDRWEITPPVAALPAAMFALYNYIDFVIGMMGIFKEKKDNDLWKFQIGTGISVRALRVFSAASTAFMGAFMAACGWLLLRGVI
jgi:hypothetical protein